MVCLEKILNTFDFSKVSGVNIIWPHAFDENNKRIRHLQDMFKKFAFALWQKGIPCGVVGNPELNYRDKDAIIATLKIVEAQALPVTLFKFEAEQLFQEQQQDSGLLKIFEEMKEKSEISNVEFSIINKVLYKVECDKVRGIVHKVFIPASLVNQVITMYHDNNCHPGFVKTLYNCRSQCYWPNMAKDISKYISKCITCVRAKVPNSRQVFPGSLLTPTQPGYTWAIDILGSLSKSGYYNKILVTVCTFQDSPGHIL